MPSTTYQKPPANEDHAFRYGRTYDSYLTTEPGWGYFWSHDLSGVVAVARKGRYLHVSGGLLASAGDKEGLLDELVDHAARQRLVLTFFNVPEDELPLFRRFGFQATKWGEEALVNLDSCTWSGGAYEWVRRQSNYCRRQGLAFSECRRDDVSAGRWDTLLGELAVVSALFLANKPQARESPSWRAISTPSTSAGNASSSPGPRGGAAGSRGSWPATLATTAPPGPWKPTGSARTPPAAPSRSSCTKPCRRSRPMGCGGHRCV